jgi:hypothetical protein
MMDVEPAFKIVVFQLQNHRKLLELVSLILRAFVPLIRTYTQRMFEKGNLRTWQEEVTGDGENDFYFSSSIIRKAVAGT